MQPTEVRQAHIIYHSQELTELRWHGTVLILNREAKLSLLTFPFEVDTSVRQVDNTFNKAHAGAAERPPEEVAPHIWL